MAPRAHRAVAGKSSAGVLQEITSALAKSGWLRNSFDCVSPRAVRSWRLGYGIVVMLDAFTALFGVISVGIFIAHACDGYWSRP
jgi:hypothetical protein